MEASDTELILCGHTHVQDKIEHDGKRVLNPGAVGVPLGSGGLEQFLILHGQDGVWREEFISQSYDIDRGVAELLLQLTLLKWRNMFYFIAKITGIVIMKQQGENAIMGQERSEL